MERSRREKSEARKSNTQNSEVENNMNPSVVIANGKEISATLPCTVEEFLLARKLLPRGVVVEHNGQAVAPSEFSTRRVHAGDKLEIVKIVAGG